MGEPRESRGYDNGGRVGVKTIDKITVRGRRLPNSKWLIRDVKGKRKQASAAGKRTRHDEGEREIQAQPSSI